MEKLLEFWKEVERRRSEPRWKPLRDGQIFYNSLFQVDLELAKRVYGTRLDPSEDDSKIETFLFYITQAWGA